METIFNYAFLVPMAFVAVGVVMIVKAFIDMIINKSET